MEKIIKILENNNWGIRDYGSYLEIRQWSNLGKDLGDDIDYTTPENFIENFKQIAESFDVDEYVELYADIRGKHGVPNCTIRELLEDADEIKELYSNTLKQLLEYKENKNKQPHKFSTLLYTLLDDYTENTWQDEPLDADEVDKLVEILKLQLNLINGNITQDEYNTMLE